MTSNHKSRSETILARGTYRELTRIEKILTTETTGGLILVGATVLALILANSPAADAYFSLRDMHVGFSTSWLDLDLSLAHWAADGLLAIFFFLVGLELKMELTKGDLRDPRRAFVPVAAAVGGVALPALLYFALNASNPETLGGWAIPAATDIAFAVAVLAIVGSKLPAALRTFLLTLAIVDDLIAITIIAVFYSSDLKLHYLAIALIPLALYWLVANKAEALFKKHYSAAWFVLLPLGLIVWALFYNSGIHATIAGVALAFMIPVNPLSKYGERYSLAETFEHRFRPLSSGVAVPIFAFFSAGVAVGGISGLTEAWTSTVALGIIVGLVAGKMLGIVGTTFLVTRLRGANLDPDIKWLDLLGVAALAGIGFTVSLLVAELSFDVSDPAHDWAKVGVLTASVLAAIVGAAILAPRNARYARIAEREKVDANRDGIPDVFSDDSARAK
ncbi:Na+/H+ antiporter NhaA [Dermabacter sp. p3-SID358]|uniref:Na+/H+ antiporter NhaA n=1 Tax=Dermabacter sp. p3-SID358 TaxID=2916114 RepID=UPI0021A968EF|nr:Na+/H+ antiporter NhaA [Dermabacter sp. p3-SID358]MCT1867456.1 Na+/H+ antiporter NhaA [Dermabacter sp. p3-SID358]